MRSLSQTDSRQVRSTLVLSFKALGHEVVAFLDAITSPAKIIAEVHEMRALQAEADRVAATDPARAAALRLRASSIGLN